MPNVEFWRGTTLQINDLPIKDGQLVYNTETGQIYQDFGIERIELGKAGGETPVVPMVDTTATLEPNKFYQWGEVAELALTLGEPKPDILNEYMFEFKSGDVATVVTGLESIKWPSVFKIEPSKTYQVSIVNGIGVMIGV